MIDTEICELLSLWSQVCVWERLGDKLGHKLAVYLNCPARFLPLSMHSNLFLLWVHCVQSEKSFNFTRGHALWYKYLDFTMNFPSLLPGRAVFCSPPSLTCWVTFSGEIKAACGPLPTLVLFCANTWIWHPRMCRMELSTWIRLTFSGSCLYFSEVITVCSLFIITCLCKDKKSWRTARHIITQQHRPQQHYKWLNPVHRCWLRDSGWIVDGGKVIIWVCLDKHRRQK